VCERFKPCVTPGGLWRRRLPLGEAIRPGVILRDLDRLATEYLKSQGAQPLYKGYRGNRRITRLFPVSFARR